MSKKRVVLRHANTETLSDVEQKEFVDDVAARIDGTGIKGYFIAGSDDGWIEWEGDDAAVDDQVQQHLDDPRVSSDYDEVEETSISSVSYDSWFGHCAPDARHIL